MGMASQQKTAIRGSPAGKSKLESDREDLDNCQPASRHQARRLGFSQ